MARRRVWRPWQGALIIVKEYIVKPFIKTPLNKGHLTTRDTRFLVPFWYFINDSSVFNDPSSKDTSIKRTSLPLVPMVSVIERLHCICYTLDLYLYCLIRFPLFNFINQRRLESLFVQDLIHWSINSYSRVSPTCMQGFRVIEVKKNTHNIITFIKLTNL